MPRLNYGKKTNLRRATLQPQHATTRRPISARSRPSSPCATPYLLYSINLSLLPWLRTGFGQFDRSIASISQDMLDHLRAPFKSSESISIKSLLLGHACMCVSTLDLIIPLPSSFLSLQRANTYSPTTNFTSTYYCMCQLSLHRSMACTVMA